jgi:hypothetical protein
MLRIPGEGDATAPLMAPLQKIDFAEEEADPRGERRTRSKRKRKAKGAEVQGWEASSGSWRASRKKGKRVFGTIAFWVLSIGAILSFVFYKLKEHRAKAAEPVAYRIDSGEESTRVPLLLPDGDMQPPIELPEVMRRSEVEFLELAKPLAEEFLAATDFGQILPLVSNRAGVEGKILNHYPDGDIEPTGLSKFNSTGNVAYKDSFAAVSILTSDFEQMQLAFIDGEDGLKIDWESWVGWSEMPWDELIEKRPSEPILIRAMLKWIDYYNFAFSDERKWRSYRLVSPDGEHMLYGYVDRNSPLDQKIRPGEPTATVAVTVRIHFPESEAKGKQVVIDQLVADGWVVPGVDE